MSLHFLLDGYNIIKQVQPLKKIRILKEARSKLFSMASASHFNRAENNRITLVFDGREDLNLCSMSSAGKIRIIFSRGESADEVIKRLLQDSSRPGNITVVSDDKPLIYFIKSCGGKGMPVADFFKEFSENTKSGSSNKLKKKNSLTPKAKLSYQEQESINRELRKIWG